MTRTFPATSLSIAALLLPLTGPAPAAAVEDQPAAVEDQAAAVEDQATAVEDQATAVEDQATAVEGAAPGAAPTAVEGQTAAVEDPAVAVDAAAGPAPARDRAPRRLRAVRLAGAPPVVDGRLDDPVWQGAPVADGFVQLRPTPGAPSMQLTEVRVLYDDDAVYVGMRLFDDEPGGIAAQLGRRDASGLFSDWAHVLIDSYHDRRTAFRFSVNPRGVQRDVLHYDDFSEDVNWDGVWEAATSVDDEGWTATFRIPLSQLRFSPNGGEMVWGINFGREIARAAESSWWAPILPDVPGVVSVAGELHGLRALDPPRRLEVLPYALARGDSDPALAGSPFRAASGREASMAVGADVKYGLTSELTLTATINPDFGQVEADPSVVNLTAQETFFSERRPFFVEGGNIFTYNIGFNDDSGEGLFYTRRIGRRPQRDVSGNGSFTDVPGTTAILGAAKVSGRTAGGWSLGLLEAVTAREEGEVLTSADSVARFVVEPMTSYTVARAARDFRRGRSGVGLIATSTHRRLESDPGLTFLPERAYTGGVDFRHRFADDTWSLNGWLAGSHVRGDTVAIQRLQRSSLRYMHRPDADHLEYDPGATTLSGYGGTLNLWRVAGTWRGGLGGTVRSPGLEVNDAGFQNEADLRLVYGNVRYHRFDPIGPFRTLSIGLNPSASWSFGSEHSHTQVNLFMNTELMNNWNGGAWTSRSFDGLSRGALRGGPALARPGGWRGNLWLNTDSRKPVRVNAWTFVAVEDEDSGWQRNGGATLTWRPSGRLDVRGGPSFNERQSEWQYVAQPRDAAGEPHYIFASIHQRTLSLTSRLNYTVTPALSLQLYAQPFISAGEYSGFRVVTDPRATRFDDRFHELLASEITFVEADAAGSAGHYEVDRTGDGATDFAFRQPDFNFKELRSNLVLRWEFRPGSTLFVVWSHGRTQVDPTGAFDARADLDRLLGVAGSNAIAIKVNYWLDL
jgi:hypothetical protein